LSKNRKGDREKKGKTKCATAVRAARFKSESQRGDGMPKKTVKTAEGTPNE